MKPLAILKLGSTFPSISARYGDFDDWIRAVLVNSDVTICTVKVDEGDPLPQSDSIMGAVLTGAHSMITNQPVWSEATAAWLRVAVPAGLPVLGICYGHQLLAHGFGGRVGDRPAGPEVGTVPVTRIPAAAADPLFCDLPTVFDAHASHFQSVIILPDGARPLANTPFERHAAFAYGPRAWGVQFHPEYTVPVMAASIQERYDALREMGRDPDRLLASLKPTPAAAALLRRFAELAKNPLGSALAG